MPIAMPGSRRWRAFVIVTTPIVLASLLQALQAIDSHSSATTTLSVALAVRRDVPARALPMGLQAPSIEPNRRVVSILAADIDADGDLDVVATDTSLELLVWTNDGSGRLTRKQPRRSSGFQLQSEPESPSVAQQKAETVLSIQNNTLSIGADSRACAFVTDVESLVTRSPFHVVAASLFGARIPRAPPSVVS